MPAPLATYYDVLRVDRDASAEGIRRAYRQLARKYHPDRQPDNRNATRAMAAVNAAYEVLSDAARRAEHDRWIEQAEAHPSTVLRQDVVVTKRWPWYLLGATITVSLTVTLLTIYVTSGLRFFAGP